VAVADILGAFHHPDMDEEVYMLLQGKIAKLKALSPVHLGKWKNKTMMYIRLKKALNGMLQAALLFWRLLSDTLQEWGSKQQMRGQQEN